MSSTDFDAVDYFRTPALYQDPYPYYEYLRAHGPVWREPHWGVVMITGFDEALQVYNDAATLLVVQHGGRAVREVPGRARGRRHQRDHRPAPRRAAVQRSAAVVRSAEAHRAARAAAAADHAEAAEGERGVHVAARRSHDRRVRRPRRVRVRARLREAVHAAGDRRPARRSRSRPRDVPRRSCRATSARRRAVERRRDGAQAVGVPLRAVHRLHRGAAGANRATT